jgi:hypothetical protein
MPRELNEENLKEAYCKVIACTGIGAAEDNCDEVFPKLVKVVVPEPMHDDYPAKLLACAINICTNKPYGWVVQNEEPSIGDTTTFQSLWSEWFTHVVHT